MMERVLWFCLMLMLPFGQVYAETILKVTKGVDEPTPIAVSPFQWSGSYALPQDVAEIVTNDLSRSGFFKLMARDDMLSFPSQQDQVFFRDWRMGGSDYLVIGRIEPVAGTRDDVSVTFELYDVIKGQKIRIDQSRYTASVKYLRQIAHRVADQIFEKLTGIPGAFSTRIAYVTAKQNGTNRQYQLIVADADGENASAVFTDKEPILSPSWGPDGKTLAFVSFETTRPMINVMDITTGKRQRVQSFRGLNGAPAWSPDGRKLALTLSKDGNPEVYILDLSVGKLNRVTHHYAIDTEPSWAPDGRSLYFTSDRGGQPQIYRVHLATREIERVTFEGNFNARARLTPDGRFMALVHRASGGGARFNIAVQDMKTGQLDVLTESMLDESPSIAPNGSVVIYATQKGTRGILSAVTLDGRVKYEMPVRGGDVREPAWSPYLN